MIWILGQLSFNQPIAKIKLKGIVLRSVYLRNTSLPIVYLKVVYFVVIKNYYFRLSINNF